MRLRGGSAQGDPVDSVIKANSKLEKQVSDLAASYDKLAKSYGIKGKAAGFAPVRSRYRVLSNYSASGERRRGRGAG